MARKKAPRQSRRTASAPVRTGAPQLPASAQAPFSAAYQACNYPEALRLAQQLTRRYPHAALAWELQANALARMGQFVNASASMLKATKLTESKSPAQQLKLAQYQLLAGQAADALPILEKLVKSDPENVSVLTWLSRAHHTLGNNRSALKASDQVKVLDPRNEEALVWRARILEQLKHHTKARDVLHTLLELSPKRVGTHNHLGNLSVKEGDYETAEKHFEAELSLDPENSQVLSNLIVANHYNPTYDADTLHQKIMEWEKRCAQRSSQGRADTRRDSAKRLRIGLLSGGFRMHPVGQMILPALQNLPPEQFELIAYSTSQVNDIMTDKIRQAVHQWHLIEGLSASELDQRIRNDSIDILIDMNGAGEGSRYTTLTREPAPLMVKWVGSLINTTGLSCIDYLISDSVETPEGVDDYYTEKLVRLPDDYICYHIPEHAPEATALPALTNGYITFGCLNNPAKLATPLLAEWAVLLHEVPNSRLLLRGIQFESEEYRAKITGIMAQHGIGPERLILEGPAQHKEYMATYQRIDIALDTWPYSGGLTTCEALMMGVPVVTRVGPTFAGRHSATHLVNAGMPELVTDNWDDFRRRAKELSSDLPNLAVIRAALRTLIVDSPICDGKRFGKHLAIALRAIWQRHCEGKSPAALTFNKGGAARFEDSEKTVQLSTMSRMRGEDIDWHLDKPITVLDNGARLATHEAIERLLDEGQVALLTLDPYKSLTIADHLAQCGEFQYYAGVTLGDGQPAVLYGGDDTQPHDIASIALDSIEGLEGVDMLVLDDSQDTLTILEHGEQALNQTLLLQARVHFNPNGNSRADFGSLTQWAVNHGFRFHRLHNPEYRSHMPGGSAKDPHYATELISADAIFVPNAERTTVLTDNQRIRFAFILYTVYGIKDLAYAMMSQIPPEQANSYFSSEKVGTPAVSALPSHRKIILIGFPKSGTTTIHKAFESSGIASAHWKADGAFVGELMYKGLQEHNDPWHFLQNYTAITQADVCLPEQNLNYWPNLDFKVIERIQELYPDCLFILNYRNPKEVVSSIKRWGNAQARFKDADIPGLPAGQGSEGELEQWITNHINTAREHFYNSNNFLEVDISSNEAPRLLEEKLGISIKWWGVANQNNITQTDAFKIPDSPHMSNEEAVLFSKTLQKASSYFEFGSGGSTVWAVKQGLTVQGVESDVKWVSSLRAKLGDSCQVKTVDIGPTREWGFPASEDHRDKFTNYSSAIHDHATAFDLVLVDGRFRVACTIAAIQHILKNHKNSDNARIFIHDFWNRPQYHTVLQFLDPVESVESAGLFKVKKHLNHSDLQKTWKKWAYNPN